MRTFTEPEHSETYYYIRYEEKTDNKYEKKFHYYWTDNQDEYQEKLFYVERHAKYNLLYKREPLPEIKWPDDLRGFGIKMVF